MQFSHHSSLQAKDSLVITYVNIMMVLGTFVVIVGSIVLYLICRHSGNIDQRYQRALLVHHLLSWFCYLVLNLAFVPMIVPPYNVIYAEGLLKDCCPTLILTLVQVSSFLVGITSRALLFHLRALAILPTDHFLGRPCVFYPMVAYYFIPSLLISPATLPFACMDQDEIKGEWFEKYHLLEDKLFNNQTLSLPMTSTALSIWKYSSGICIGSFVIITVTLAIWALSALNSKANMSQSARSSQRKLIMSLIIQTVFYNLIFIVMSLIGLVCMFVGLENGREVFVAIMLTYSASFLIGSVLLVLTNDSYRIATFKSWSYTVEPQGIALNGIPRD